MYLGGKAAPAEVCYMALEEQALLQKHTSKAPFQGMLPVELKMEFKNHIFYKRQIYLFHEKV